MQIQFGDPASFSVKVVCEHGERGSVVVTEAGRAFGDEGTATSLPEAAGWWLRDLSLHRSPLVLSDPPARPLGGASIVVGHPAAARAVLLAFAEWVRRGCGPDADELVGRAHFAQRAALAQGPDGSGSIRLPHELLRGWEAVVAASEDEPIDEPDELSYDVQVRDAIERVLDALPSDDPHRAAFAAQCAALDERFRALLPRVDGSPRPEWWRSSLPRQRV